MVFQGEDVPLTEDVIKKPRDFIPTQTEWAARNRKRIYLDAAASGSLFTVAQGTTVWLTNIHLTSAGTSTVTVSNPTGIRIITAGNDKDLVMHRHNLNKQEQSSSISFPMPFEVKEGEIISFIEGSNIGARVMVLGWEEPKKIT